MQHVAKSPRTTSRRTFFRRAALGATGLAIVPLLRNSGLLAAEGAPVTSPGDPQQIFQAALDAAIAAGELGMQIAVYKDGKQVVDVYGGHMEENGRKVDRDTIFGVFSVTKAVTNVALQIQAERGLIDYNKPVAFYWPEFAANGKAKCTVRDVLSHRAGLPQMPDGVTPEKMADYDWMVKQLAAMKPLYEPGTTNAYHSYTWGWLVSEIVRRTDSKKRDFGRIVQEEICQPLGIKSLWLGIPDSVIPRVAKMYGTGSSTGAVVGESDRDVLFRKTIPPQVTTSPEVWELPIIRRSCQPGAGMICNAASLARFWGMLANGGQLDGVRLLSPERIRAASVPRPETDRVDPVLGSAANISTLGFWLRGSGSSVGTSPHLLAQTGAGNNIGWADPDTGLAVAITHNRYGGAYSRPLREAVKRAFAVV
jgi:CubicO group peptidase (beta-lactamase class C family)